MSYKAARCKRARTLPDISGPGLREAGCYTHWPLAGGVAEGARRTRVWPMGEGAW